MEVDPSARAEAGAAVAAASDLAPGASIGKYRLERILGSGGMGVVWAAFDPDLERAVAIKVLRSIDDGASLRTRLLREARAMARLKHPNILTVYEVGTDRNRDYIAMELIDGDDLDAWLRTKPPRAEILAALFAAGRGLAAAHDAGLIHRDLKPHNILRGRDGSVYVTDFGLARGQIEDGAEIVQQPIAVAATAVASGSYPRGVDSVLDSPLTQTGVLIGTPAYMAPEQFAGRAPDPRSDQFAFCITVWEALTGSRPFAGSTLDELRAAASGSIPPATDSLPPRVRTVLARGLSADPEGRWPDMRTLLRELEGALKPAPCSRRTLYIGAAVTCAAVATGGVLFARHRSASSINDCGPPEEAFASAWSPEKRKAAMAWHKLDVTGVATLAALDDLRAKWLAAYESTCRLPPSATRHERLGCLLELRDDARDLTSEMEEDGKINVGAIIPMTIAMGMCTGFTGKNPETPKVPMIPNVPTPPIPPIPGIPSPPPPKAPQPPSHTPDPWDVPTPDHASPSRPPRPPAPTRGHRHRGSTAPASRAGKANKDNKDDDDKPDPPDPPDTPDPDDKDD
ncbi:MAG TPA: serine/threonine-protein kinase [Kofleriaceae bacterium]|nr:serine/threonine-protein kinase [Kofleriaceae bacterium]